MEAEEEEPGGVEAEVVEMGVRRLGGWMTLGDQSAEVAGSLLLKMELNPGF